MELKNLQRNRSEVSEGQWVTDIPNLGDVELKVRGLTSDEALSFRTQKERATPRSERLKDGNLKPKAAYKVFRETLCEAVLLDWKGITEDGKSVKYSKTKAREIFENEDMSPFHDAVVWAAQVVDFGYETEKEELAGNSRPISDGS